MERQQEGRGPGRGFMWRCQEVSFYVGFVAGWDAHAGRGCGQQARSVGGWSGKGHTETAGAETQIGRGSLS